jgi:hypothetical protein
MFVGESNQVPLPIRADLFQAVFADLLVGGQRPPQAPPDQFWIASRRDAGARFFHRQMFRRQDRSWNVPGTSFASLGPSTFALDDLPAQIQSRAA